MNRGDRHGKIFEDNDDRHRFLKTLAQTCDKTGWQVHALFDVQFSPRRDPPKVQLAGQFQAQTTMTLKWIAQQL